eukprot:m.303922 g.303922  ORF g.303922 m.303922 type:complete len:105 (-) comp19596_c0_seq13:2153-2467(-)
MFLKRCSNCTFALACQQLRIHDATDTNFYLHVTGKAIIEDCDRLQFAPYTWTYPDIDAHYEVSGLDRSRNMWDQVDDFKWLKAGQPSPHWSVLPESQRKEFAAE